MDGDDSLGDSAMVLLAGVLTGSADDE